MNDDKQELTRETAAQLEIVRHEKLQATREAMRRRMGGVFGWSQSSVDEFFGKAAAAVTGPVATPASEPITPTKATRPGRPIRSQISVNDRMRETIAAIPESRDWTARQFATRLNCSPSSVTDTEMWGALKTMKAAAELSRMNRDAGIKPGDTQFHRRKKPNKKPVNRTD